MQHHRHSPARPADKSHRIKRIAESVISLPTLPTVVAKLIEAVDNPRSSASSVARLISTDQSLTARILKLANSAYYGLSREVSTVNRAIVVLGFNTVKDMGLSLTVLDMFKNGVAVGAFEVPKFWQHSIACGVAARMIARRFCPGLAGEAFVAGLLHDIGKVVVNQYAHAEFAEIMMLVQGGAHDLDEAEDAVLGARHGRIGGWLAEKWRLPGIIAGSIKYHHTPWEAPGNRVFVSIVTIADYLCHVNKVGASGRGVVKEPDPRTWEVFSDVGIVLDCSMIDTLAESFRADLAEAETFVSLIQEPGRDHESQESADASSKEKDIRRSKRRQSP